MKKRRRDEAGGGGGDGKHLHTSLNLCFLIALVCKSRTLHNPTHASAPFSCSPNTAIPGTCTKPVRKTRATASENEHGCRISALGSPHSFEKQRTEADMRDWNSTITRAHRARTSRPFRSSSGRRRRGCSAPA